MPPLAKVLTVAFSAIWAWIFLETAGYTGASLFLPTPIEASPAPTSIFEQGSQAATLPLETVNFPQQHESPTFTKTVYAQTIVTRVFEPTRTVTAWSIVTETRTPIISPVAQPAPVEITRHGYDDLLFVGLFGFLLGLASMAFVHWCRHQDELERDNRRRQEPSNATILKRMNAVMEALQEQPARAAPAQMRNIDTARPAGAVKRVRNRGLIEAPVTNEEAAKVEAPAVVNVGILLENRNLADIGDMQDRKSQEEEARLIAGRSYLDAESEVVDAPVTDVTETEEPHATDIAPIKPLSNDVTAEPTAGVAEEKAGDQTINARETETLQAMENALAPAGNEEHEDAADVHNDGDAEADAGGYGEAQANVAIETAPVESVNNDEHDEPDADDEEPAIDQAIEDDNEQASVQPQQDNDPARGFDDTESNAIHGEQQEATPSVPTDDQSGTQTVVNMGEPKETSPIGADTGNVGVVESEMQDGPKRGGSHAGNALSTGHGNKVDASETPRLRPDDPAVAQGEDFAPARRYDPKNAAQRAEDLADLAEVDDDDQRRRLEISRKGQRPIKAPRRPRARQTVPQTMTPATNISPVRRETEPSAPIAVDSEMSGVQTASVNGHPSSNDPSLSVIQTNGHHAASFPPLPGTQVDGPQPANINEGGDVEMRDDTPAIGQEPGPANIDDKIHEDTEAPAESAVGSLHTTSAFVSENKQQVIATERPAPDNANTPEVEMRDGPAVSLFTASAGLHEFRDRQHSVATETQQNQPMPLVASAGVAIAPISQEMSVAAETQHPQPDAPSAFAGLIGRPENRHKPFATEQQLHQPGALHFSGGGTSQPVDQHKAATKETQYPQHEALGSSEGVIGRPAVQHKALATETQEGRDDSQLKASQPESEKPKQPRMPAKKAPVDPFITRTNKPKPQRAPEHASQNHAPALQSRLNTTPQPQFESFGSLTGVTSKLEARQKALNDKAEARQKAFSKAEGHGVVLATKKRKDEYDSTKQTQEDSEMAEEDEGKIRSRKSGAKCSELAIPRSSQGREAVTTLR